MSNSTFEQVLNQIYEISLKARILREWQENHAARQPKYSERDLLVLELISIYAPITAKEIGSVFGLAPSSTKELIRKLELEKLLEFCSKEQSDNREKPLKLTTFGEEELAQLKQSGVMRYEYLLRGLDGKKLADLSPLLGDINKSISATVQYFVFQN